MQTRGGIEVYRQADAARRLRVSRQRVGQMIREGELYTIDEDGYRLVTAESMRVVQAKLNRLIKSRS